MRERDELSGPEERTAPTATADPRRRAALAMGTAGAAALAVLGAGRARAADAAAAQADVRARHVPVIPEDPSDAAWIGIGPVAVALLPQQMVPPMLAEGSIREVRLRALHDGRDIAFHLAWEDDAADDVNAMDRFTDAVAVQLPLVDDGTTPVLMGAAGKPVHILHWKASWDREIRDGPRQVRDAFPYAVNELPPERVLGEEGARVVYPARYVGNLAASRDRASSVEELVAEGFGTLTTHERQRASGRGVLEHGRWRVVIRLPMAGDAGQVTLEPGAVHSFALAAWDGGRSNRGARKHWSDWRQLHVEPLA
jgi:hypothetical protein